MKEENKKQQSVVSFETPRPSLAVFGITVLIVLGIFAGTWGTRAVMNMRTGSGKVVSEPREVDSFTKLVARGDVKIKIAKGDTESVSVLAEDNVMSDVTTSVSDKTLTVSHAVKGYSLLQAHPTKDVVVTVVVKSLSDIVIEGSASATGKNVPTDEIQITNRSSQNVNFGLNPKKLTAVVEGAGSLSLNGSADSAKFTVSGAGTLNAKELNVREVNATLSGAGDVLCSATETLTATIPGSGDIQYAGNPKTVNKKISGSGQLKKL